MTTYMSYVKTRKEMQLHRWMIQAQWHVLSLSETSLFQHLKAHSTGQESGQERERAGRLCSPPLSLKKPARKMSTGFGLPSVHSGDSESPKASSASVREHCAGASDLTVKLQMIR